MKYIILYFAIGLFMCMLAGWSRSFKDDGDREIVYVVFLLIIWPALLPFAAYEIGKLLSGDYKQ